MNNKNYHQPYVNCLNVEELYKKYKNREDVLNYINLCDRRGFSALEIEDAILKMQSSIDMMNLISVDKVNFNDLTYNQ